jgi:hypothetical protein
MPYAIQGPDGAWETDSQWNTEPLAIRGWLNKYQSVCGWGYFRNKGYTCVTVIEGEASELAALREEAERKLVEAQQWKEVVIDKLVIGHIYCSAHDHNPQKAMNDLLSWEITIALDPKVSELAQELKDTAERNALEQAAKVCEERAEQHGFDMNTSWQAEECAEFIRALMKEGGE